MRRRHGEGIGRDEMPILYRSNALSRGFEEALMRARIPYVLVGDVGFYQRAEIKDALALLRLAATPDDAQADEALRRVINVPARGFGAKAMEVLEAEAAWRHVSLLAALEIAGLPPKARSSGLAFADAIRGVGRDRSATLADQLSLLLDATGCRATLRESRAETTEGRLENVQELIQLAAGFHTARELLDHAALSTGGPNEDTTERVRLMTPYKGKELEFPQVFLPGWESGVFPPDYGAGRGTQARLCGDHPRHAMGDPLALRVPPRLCRAVPLSCRHPGPAPGHGVAEGRARSGPARALVSPPPRRLAESSGGEPDERME